MYEQIDFRFRCQVGTTSLHAALLQYLQSKQTAFPREQMILWSLSAFWHPLACKWLGKSTEAELKQKARNAIYELQQHINYLARNFELEPQDFVFSGTGYEKNDSLNQMSIIDQPSVPTAPTEALAKTMTDALNGADDLNALALSKPSAPAVELMMSSDDDKLLDELFNK